MYIEKLPKSLLKDIVDNRCIPFIGAGFSLNASSTNGVKIPDWNGLGKKAAAYLSAGEDIGPIEALSQYEEQYSRADLIEMVAQELHINKIFPGEAHLKFCRLHFNLVCTTNFDFLLENAFGEIYSSRGKPYHVISNENRLSTYLGEETTILKLHGDFNDPAKMVITENDYDLYIANNPLFVTYIANLLITKTPLLIGYSLNDPDLRMIWSIIGSRLGSLRRTGYAILCSATDSDIARFKRRGITVINLPVKKEKYSEALSTLFEELLEYWDKQSSANLETSKEDVAEKIKYDVIDSAKLCFFSVPYSKLSLYKKYVFPIVRKYGMIPTAADDFFLPGDNISAKISAIIQKASIAVVDISDGSAVVNMEVGIIVEKKIPCVIISSNTDLIPIEMTANYVIKGDFDIGISELLSAIEDRISYISKDLNKRDSSPYDEPRRLYELKEYNAAVISSIRLLEITLSEYRLQAEHNGEISKAPKTLRNLIDFYCERSNSNYYSEIQNWITTRNRVVHSQYSVTRQQCKKIVDGVYQVINQINGL